MAGSPKKRARREAERLRREALDKTQSTQAQPVEVGPTPKGYPGALPAPVALKGEVLPPLPKGDDPDFTRTALKRAMRKRAQEYSEKAIAALAAALEGGDLKTKLQAANDLLAWGFGKPATEIEAGEGGIAITILRLADQPQEI